MSRTRIAAAAVAFLGFATALHCLVTPDLWWHLAAGRWILDHRAVPTVDVLSWTMTDRPWIDLQWLGDVGLVALWRSAGPEGVVLGKALAFGAVGALLVAAAGAAGAGATAAGLAAALAVLASAERTLARPEIATYVAFSLTLLAIHRVRAGRRRWAFVLPIVALVWANLHALAFLGPATVLMHAGLASLETRGPTALRGAVPPASRAARDLALSGAASAVAILGNPYGLAAWTFPLTLLRRIDGAHAAFGRILEFSRPLDDPGDPALRFFWIALAAFAVAIGTGAVRRRLPVAAVASTLPFLVLALLARRNVPLFAWALVPVLATIVPAAPGRFASRGLARAGGAVALAAVVGTAVALLGGGSPALLGLPRDRGLAVTPGLFPETCLQALDRAGDDRPLFHDIDFGGYVAWREPSRPSFIDGRLEVAGADWFERFVRAHEDPKAWERMRSSWGLDVLLLEHRDAGGAAFVRALLASGEWRAECLSAEAALLTAGNATAGEAPAGVPAGALPGTGVWSALLAENRGPQPGAGGALAFLRPLHDRLAGRPSPSAVRRAVRLANLCLTLDRFAEARIGYRAVLAAAPRDAEAWVNLGLCDLREGDAAAARDVWGEALRRVGRSDRAAIRSAMARAGLADASGRSSAP